jgi:hypothetical protein
VAECRHSDTEEVTGSNPVRPTTFFEILSSTESPNESQRPAALSRNRWPGRRLASCTRDVRQLCVGFIDRRGSVTLENTIRDSGLWAFRQRRSTRGRSRSPGCLRPGAKILMPSARNTASNELVNWPARSPIRNLTAVARCPSSIETLRVHAPSGLAVMSARRTRRVPIRSRSGRRGGGAARCLRGRSRLRGCCGA